MHDEDGLARALLDLQALTERLRRDCPWDRAQTLKTIVPHTVEEAYEVADAAASADDAKLLDELGDLLFQAFFLSLLLEEKGEGGLQEVAERLHEKLIRRHPHVFLASGEPGSPEAVKKRWEELKTEQEPRDGIFHHVPEALPALLLAQKVQRRAANAGFDWPDAAGPLAKVREETDELAAEVERAGAPAPETEPDARVEAEVGDLLFTVVNLARRLNVDPELALRRTTQTFVTRVERAAALAASDGREWTMLALEDQDRLYTQAKEAEQG